MQNHLKKALWLHGDSRSLFGPRVGALVPLNLLAGAFTHSHSDASMRILHGYSSLGLFCGVYIFFILYRSRDNIKYKMVYILFLLANLQMLSINSWIAINGMDIPYGRLFHILLAFLLILNFLELNKSLKFFNP